MRAKRSTLRAAAAAAVLILAACTSSGDLAQAVAEEQQAEQIIRDVEALPDETEGKAELLADAIKAEAALEAQRLRLERLTQRGLIDAGIDAAKDIGTGDYIGGAETLFGVALAAVAVYLRRKQKVDLAELERRRDESRARQGIAAANARSVDQAASSVALAARREQDAQTQGAVAREVARILADRTPQVAPPAGGTAHSQTAQGAAPGVPSHPQAAAPMPPAATYYGDPNRWPVAPTVEGPGVGA